VRVVFLLIFQSGKSCEDVVGRLNVTGADPNYCSKMLATVKLLNPSVNCSSPVRGQAVSVAKRVAKMKLQILA